MRFEGVVRRQHVQELFNAIQLRIPRRHVSGLELGGFVVVVLATTIAVQWLADTVAIPVSRGGHFGPSTVAIIALLAGSCITGITIWALHRRNAEQFKSTALREGGSYFGRRHYGLGIEGFSIEGAHGHSLMRWSGITEMTEAPHTFLLWTDPGAAIMVPKEAFADDDAREAFKALVMERIAAPKAE